MRARSILLRHRSHFSDGLNAALLVVHVKIEGDGVCQIRKAERRALLQSYELGGTESMIGAITVGRHIERNSF